MIRYRCSKCAATLQNPPSMAGKTDECPKCGNSHIVPRSSKMGLIALLVGGVLIVGVLVGTVVWLRSRPQKPTPTPNPVANGTEVQTKGPPAKKLTLQLGGGVTMELVLIPAGKFLMGSPTSEPGRDDDEGPQREVAITQPFYMGVTEVTQAQWRAVMGTNAWEQLPVARKFTNKAPENAAAHLNWDHARAFCAKLSKKTGRAIRLPTEAQWEYACRAGSKTAYCFGDDPSKLGEYAWYDKNTGDKERYAHAVGKKKPNAWGLYDMHGNAHEWCSDFHDKKYYSAEGNTVDPTGPASSVLGGHVRRGGSFFNDHTFARSANRFWSFPRHMFFDHGGIRVVSPVVVP